MAPRKGLVPKVRNAMQFKTKQDKAKQKDHQAKARLRTGKDYIQLGTSMPSTWSLW